MSKEKEGAAYLIGLLVGLSLRGVLFIAYVYLAIAILGWLGIQ